jgi:hypothetical protein
MPRRAFLGPFPALRGGRELAGSHSLPCRPPGRPRPEACTHKFASRNPRRNVSMPECFGQNLMWRVNND